MDNKRLVKNPDERHIVSKGKYDMNFIDWDNEWNQVYNSGYAVNNIHEMQTCPINGMPLEVFKEILQREFERFEYEQEQSSAEQNKLGEENIKMIKKMKMGISSKECTICCNQFVKGEIIMKLPCSHIFHEECLLPWFNKESRCPNCRMDLKKHLQN